MAASLQRRVKEREDAEKALLSRSFQQTVIGALGQFALLSNDFVALLNQVAMLSAQRYEFEYCCVLELLPDEQAMLLRAGTGWRPEAVGEELVTTEEAAYPIYVNRR